MSKIISSVNNSKSNNKPIFGVKDTDFLLKLIMRSSFEGSEIETAHVVITKLAELHRANLED